MQSAQDRHRLDMADGLYRAQFRAAFDAFVPGTPLLN
jgi:hypothetical protein